VKRIVWEVFALALIAFGIAGCARFQRLDLEDVPTYTLDDLGAYPDPLSCALKAGRPAAIVRIAAGEKLPVRLAVHSPLLDLEASDAALHLGCDAFLYVSRSMILASPDRERWAPIDDARSLGQLFGLGQGALDLGFTVHRSKGPLLTIGLSRP
jgi:hypothetical protein